MLSAQLPNFPVAFILPVLSSLLLTMQKQE